MQGGIHAVFALSFSMTGKQVLGEARGGLSHCEWIRTTSGETSVASTRFETHATMYPQCFYHRCDGGILHVLSSLRFFLLMDATYGNKATGIANSRAFILSFVARKEC